MQSNLFRRDNPGIFYLLNEKRQLFIGLTVFVFPK